uniref:Uncharacterized protein n=1 Tax=Candidatus Kentrum sp. DK TaxID=2126562 RepID=A0A450SNN7_9GAMM|nr:MAG: hypothetical protein BECKDK2373C_GA0170839_10484 [Candidatus Kentron sp. DK]VFJ55455.1 MAG: hypothetical protein BECKDK2373B_GA0170837_105221 [Candidatus Kentron sp. DK]
MLGRNITILPCYHSRRIAETRKSGGFDNISKNPEFARQLGKVSKRKSLLSESHPDPLADFSEIISGEYAVTQRDQLYFQPKGKRRLKGIAKREGYRSEELLSPDKVRVYVAG